MKLSSRITYYLIVIVFLSLAIGFSIFYISIERVTNRSAIYKMEQLNQYIIKQLKTQSGDSLQKKHPSIRIKVLSKKYDNLVDEVVEEREAVWNEQLQSYGYNIKVIHYPFVNNEHYQITNEDYIVKIEKEYWFSVLMVVAWIFVFILTIIIFFGEMIARNLYMPFYSLLIQMKMFDVRKGEQIQVMNTNTTELDELNKLFTQMADKSIQQYKLLKEFTENLSHELQTPLANLKGKIELLLDTNLSEQQMQALSGMYDELNRMSTLNRSLVLLMSLEDHEVSPEKVNLSDALRETILHYEDIIEMGGKTLNVSIQDNIYININPMLLQIVLSNLINNASRHNIEKGSIEIALTNNFLEIKNTGNPNSLTNETIFNRFKKGTSDSSSLGIGLALVKKIVEVYGYKIIYKKQTNFHIFILDINV
ncbi:MAG: HAMP domain-containing sensor histidine kinase [Myroides sp.]